MEVMKTFKDKQFSLAIADPPYGIGMDGGNVGYKGFNDFAKKNWDSEIPGKEYFEELTISKININCSTRTEGYGYDKRDITKFDNIEIIIDE